MESIIRILFPEHCLHCGTLGITLCPSCLASLPRAHTLPLALDAACFSYTHPTIQRAIERLKYKRGKGVAKAFAPYITDRLLDYVEDAFLSGSKLYVCAIPLRKASKRARGYNQAALLIEYATLPEGITYLPELLYRTEERPSQTFLSRAARLHNIHNTFGVRDDITGAVICVIDDVSTTGATIAEAKRALYAAGAAAVYGIVIAH